MKRRAAHRGFGLGLTAAGVTALALLPLYGDPRPSPVTHPGQPGMAAVTVETAVAEKSFFDEI